MASSGQTKAQAVLHALTTLDPFDYSAYESGVQNLLGVDSASWSNVVSSEIYGESPTLGSVPNIVQRFKVQTIALGVSRNDKYGFSDTVIMNGFQERLCDTSSALVVPVYRKHLEQHLASEGINDSVLSLSKDLNFCTAFLTTVLSPTFINDALISRYLGSGCPQYTEAIAYLYERMRPTLTQQPATQTYYCLQTATDVPVTQVATASLPNIAVYSQAVMANEALTSAGRTQDFLATSLPISWSDNVLLQEPQFKRMGVAWANLWMANTYATGIVSTLITSDESFKHYRDWSGHTAGSDWVTYGDKLWQWIKTQEANGYSDIFHMTQSENSKLLSPYGCFAPGTVISTAAGDMPVECVKASAKILTKAPGQYGQTSSEMVVHPTVMTGAEGPHRVVPLYGFNEEPPFVTAGHIFFTTSGPRAIDPEVAKLENTSAKVGHLQEGDILLRLNSDMSGYDKVKINKITRTGAKCPYVHGIHLGKGSEGGHKYHANGYWVGENYPQLTIKSLADKYNRMTLSEKRAFSKHIANLPASFRHVLGPAVFDTVQRFFSVFGKSELGPASRASALGNPSSSLLDKVEEAGKHHVPLSSVVSHYRLIHHEKLRAHKKTLSTQRSLVTLVTWRN